MAPTVTSLATGDSRCPAGGVFLTSADGGVTIICNGAQGTPGQAGSPGQPGANGVSVVVTPLPAGSGLCLAGGLSVTAPDGGVQVLCNGEAGAAGQPGSPGSAGAPGAPGDLRIYGDGSGGSLVVSADDDWSANPTSPLYLNNLTINAGVTLTVPSGMVLRVAGTFTNNGTIHVNTWGGDGSFVWTDEPVVGGTGTVAVPMLARSPGRGIAATPPTSPQFTRGAFAFPGTGGFGIRSRVAARLLTRPGDQAGGGGAGAQFGAGGEGGGSLVVLAKGALVNNGLIDARGGSATGGSCGGGGGGGVVVLASALSVTNGPAAQVTVAGGDGRQAVASPGAYCGGGGSGGGGFVHVIAPTQSLGGLISVGPGTPGAGNATLAATPISGGGGGGASGGNGGNGASVNVGQAIPAGSSGGNGFTIASLVDPAPMF